MSPDQEEEAAIRAISWTVWSFVTTFLVVPAVILVVTIIRLARQ